MNYDLFRRYLAFCVERGFVTVTESHRSDEVRLTAAGVEAHRRLIGWIRDLLGDGVV